MWVRSQEANSRSERVNTNLKELVLTRCHFKEFGAKLMTCYYITSSGCDSIFQLRKFLTKPRECDWILDLKELMLY